MPDSASSPTASASSRLSGKTLVDLLEPSWSSGCSSASTLLLDEHSSHTLIRALFRGDLASAEEHLAYGVPLPGIPAMQGLLERPDMDLNRTTNSKHGDGIIHFLLRASASHFVDGKVETIKLCIRHGVNLTQQGAQGDTIFHLLCGPIDYGCSFSEDYNLSLLRFLFEERPDDAQVRAGVDFRNDYGNTPLMVAVLYGFSESVQFLLEKGADLEIRGEEGKKPLSWALQREQMGIVNTLLDHGACFDDDIARETDVMIMKRIIDGFRSSRRNRD